MRSSAFSSAKRVRELAAYSAIAIAVVMAAAISPMGSNLALAIGLGAFVGLVGVGSVFPFHILAKAALVSAVWASVYGLKSAGVPLLEIPVYLAVVGLGFATVHRHGEISNLIRINRLSKVSAHWSICRSHFKTTALLTLSFSALSVVVFWVLEGAGIDNVLPIVLTMGLAILGIRYVTGHRASDTPPAKPASSSRTSVSSLIWTFFASTMLLGVAALMFFGSHQGVVSAMDSTLRLEGQDETQALDSGISSTIDFQTLEAFTSHPWNEDCMPAETGVRYRDPVNLVFVGQTLDEVKLSLLAEGWITSSRRGSDQYLRWGSQEYHRYDLQLHFYESLRARYHVRLWESPDQAVVVEAVHHESGVIHHTIDIDWDEAQRFVSNQLCKSQCALSDVFSDHSSIQGETDFWRAVGNDGQATIISDSK